MNTQPTTDQKVRDSISFGRTISYKKSGPWAAFLMCALIYKSDRLSHASRTPSAPSAPSTAPVK
jgi:hypothetical protein